MSKKVTASETEIKKLYEPETFYEHGDNPAFKKFMEVMVENVREGRLPDYRTYVVEKYTKSFQSFILSKYFLDSSMPETGMISFKTI